MKVLFIFIDRMPFMASTLDNADPFFALVITTCFYLHHVEVADRDPAICRLIIFLKKLDRKYLLQTD